MQIFQGFGMDFIWKPTPHVIFMLVWKLIHCCHFYMHASLSSMSTINISILVRKSFGMVIAYSCNLGLWWPTFLVMDSIWGKCILHACDILACSYTLICGYPYVRRCMQGPSWLLNSAWNIIAENCMKINLNNYNI